MDAKIPTLSPVLCGNRCYNISIDSRLKGQLTERLPDWPSMPLWAYSSAVERSAHNRVVPGSNPGGPIKYDKHHSLE